MTFYTDIHCWDDLLSSWAIASATGIVALATLCLWGRYFSLTTSLRIYLMIFVGLTLATASLLAWQKEHRESIQAENIASLKAFNTEANRLFEQSLAVNSAVDYTAFLAKADGFSVRLERWVGDNMGPRASEILLRHDPKELNVAFESAIDKDHASAMATIIQTKENIEALIEAKVSDKCVKPAMAEHPFPPSVE
jgi:hypothetical protein